MNELPTDYRLDNTFPKKGTWPIGLSRCFIAGIAGDQTGDKCIFDGEDFCVCESRDNNE